MVARAVPSQQGQRGHTPGYTASSAAALSLRVVTRAKRAGAVIYGSAPRGAWEGCPRAATWASGSTPRAHGERCRVLCRGRVVCNTRSNPPTAIPPVSPPASQFKVIPRRNQRAARRKVRVIRANIFGRGMKTGEE